MISRHRRWWEKRALIPGYQKPLFHGSAVRYVVRRPLGTPNPVVVTQMGGDAGDAELPRQCALLVDATGGNPVVDMLSAAGVEPWNVPNRDLISGLQLLLERGELRIAKSYGGVGRLMPELLDVRTTRRENGRTGVGRVTI